KMADDGALGADPEGLADRLVPIGRALEDEYDRTVRLDDPAEPGPERWPERDRLRARSVGDGVVGRRTEVEEESAARDRTPCLVDGHRPRRGDASAEEGRTCLVRRPHPGEVARNSGLAMEQPTREVLDVLDPEQRVVSPLVADRRRRRRGNARGAQRARAVGRLD